MSIRALCLLAVVAMLGCGGGGSHKSTGSVSSGSSDGGLSAVNSCMDEDDDGFGLHCKLGKDCDDTDPTVTDECYRCLMPTIGCPCMAGTPGMHCDPHYMMSVTMNGQTGTLTCHEGTRYCRDGVYSDCEVLLQYATFSANK